MSLHTTPDGNIFSASSVTTFEECPKKYWYEYILGYQSKELSTGLKTGIIMHEAQAYYLGGLELGYTIELIESEVREVHRWDKEDELFLPKIRSYIRGYYNRWEKEDLKEFDSERYEVISIEKDFLYTILNSSDSEPIKFVGKMDAVILDKLDDCILFMEHKNTSVKQCQDTASIWWQKLIMDNQMNIYADALKVEYNKPVYAWYDVVLTSPRTKPGQIKKIAKRKSETPEEYLSRKAANQETIEEFEERLTDDYLGDPSKFIRKKIPILDSPNSQRIQEIDTIIAQARDAIKKSETDSGKSFYRNTKACENYGGCKFFQSCIGTERIEESSKFEIKPHYIKETE